LAADDTMLAKLNLVTRPWHAPVDDAWLDLLRPDTTSADYLAQLVRMYGLVAPFESACKYTPGVGRYLDTRQLLRAGLIAQDILALGVTPAQVATIQTCPAIMSFNDVAEAFAWLYVVERSTLLQEGVRRHLLQVQPGLAKAVSYLAAFDTTAGERWLAFDRMLDRVVAELGVEAQLLSAAEAAFASTRAWLSATRSASRSFA